MAAVGTFARRRRRRRADVDLRNSEQGEADRVDTLALDSRELLVAGCYRACEKNWCAGRRAARLAAFRRRESQQSDERRGYALLHPPALARGCRRHLRGRQRPHGGVGEEYGGQRL